jgi:cytochrome P450
MGGVRSHHGLIAALRIFTVVARGNANPEPDRFDIRRKDIRHQSFGGNKHLCLGANLARVETREAILALIQQFPKLALLEQEFDYRPVPSFRALTQLWVSR